jgi:hypothetical protein
MHIMRMPTVRVECCAQALPANIRLTVLGQVEGSKEFYGKRE